MAVQSLQHCLNFHLIPRRFPKDGKFCLYFKISTGGDIRTAAIIGRYTLIGSLAKTGQGQHLILKLNP